jgi:hypothetical protein
MSWITSYARPRPEDDILRRSDSRESPAEDFTETLFPQPGLVPPYAFNYSRAKCNHAFLGLAFANFNASHEAHAAVNALNDFELGGTRLRIALKKLPAKEQ